MPDVLCMGEILIDFISLDVNCHLRDASSFRGAAGGAPANVAVGLQRLGVASVAFLGKVGKDPFGQKLRQTLQEEGVDTSLLLEDEEKRTTINFVANWSDGHKELCFYRGADQYLDPNDVTSNRFNNVKCLHYGSITFINEPGASAQKKALEMARDSNRILLTYDPNYRPTLWYDEATASRMIMNGYQYAHVAKISQEEWDVATGGRKDLEDGIQAVLKCGVELLIVSRGDGGAMATNGKFVVESEAIQGIKVIETTGAGDGFMAAVVTKLLPEFERLGHSLKNIDADTVKKVLDFANVVGGLTCTKAGAIPALPTMSQVDEFVASRCQSTTPEQASTLRPEELAGMIDHTFLKPYGQLADIEQLCREAREYGFAMVAIHPSQVKRCAHLLRGSSVKVGACIGFPLGQSTTAVKTFETRDAVENGATEIDMVMNVFELQNGNYEYVQRDIEAVVQVCKSADKDILCKVIIETCYLTNEQKVKACELSKAAGADFVKTSTGFGAAGATVDDVCLMRKTVGHDIGVKASGGVRTLESVKAMITAGASRVGTSSGVAIMKEAAGTNEDGACGAKGPPSNSSLY